MYILLGVLDFNFFSFFIKEEVCFYLECFYLIVYLFRGTNLHIQMCHFFPSRCAIFAVHDVQFWHHWNCKFGTIGSAILALLNEPLYFKGFWVFIVAEFLISVLLLRYYLFYFTHWKEIEKAEKSLIFWALHKYL